MEELARGISLPAIVAKDGTTLGCCCELPKKENILVIAY